MSWAQRSRPARREQRRAQQRPGEAAERGRRGRAGPETAAVQPPGPALGEPLPDLLVEARDREEDRGAHARQRLGEPAEVLEEGDVHRRPARSRGRRRRGSLPPRGSWGGTRGSGPGPIRAFHGRSALIVSAIHSSCPWLKPTPFGEPVVPEVKRRVAGSDGATGAPSTSRPERGAPPRAQLPLPSARNASHDRIHRERPAGNGPAAEGSDRDHSLQRRDMREHVGCPDQQQARLGGLHDLADLRDGRGVVEGHAHRPRQADGRVEREVAAGVQPHQGDPVPAADAQRAQRAGGRDDLAGHLGAAPRADLTVDRVVHGHGQPPALQPGQDLLVHRAIGPAEEAALGRVGAAGAG